jgi:hypothetical protein
LAVQVTLYGVYPIVPYDFSLENRCWFGGRFAGPADSSETYPLLGPWYAAGSGATSSETVNLNDVPAGVGLQGEHLQRHLAREGGRSRHTASLTDQAAGGRLTG